VAILPLSELPGWRLADPAQDLRGRTLLDQDGRAIGTVTELAVNTETELVEAIVLDTGLAFPPHKLRLDGDGVHLR
jgi:sporulation protein YlmC with PRC-barrel domain